MARRTKNKGANVLAGLLEAGKPIAGRLGYVAVDGYDREGVFIKVKAIGLKSEGCGIQVAVAPLSGKGEFAISPCEWFDDVKTIDAARKKAAALEAAKEQFADIAKRPHYIGSRRQALEKYVAEKMTKAQRKDFDQHLADSYDGKSIAQLPTQAIIADLAKKAVCVVNGLDGEEAEQIRTY